MDPTIETLSRILHIERNVRHAESLEQYGFIICNQTRQIIPYDLAIFWYCDRPKQFYLQSVSGTSEVQQDSPFAEWVLDLVEQLTDYYDGPYPFDQKSIDPKLTADWNEWLGEQAIQLPLSVEHNQVEAGLILTRKRSFEGHELALLKELLDAFKYSYARYKKPKRHHLSLHWHATRKQSYIALAMIIGILFLPVRQTALAPAEIVAKDPYILSAPFKGVIKTIDISPNQMVKEGDRLFSLDDLDLRQQERETRQRLRAAEEQYRKTNQYAFSNPDSKSDLAALQSQIQIEKINLQHTQQLLAQLEVKAPQNGVVIFNSKHDFLGKPVVTGERIMTLANPHNKEVKVRVPVTDAIRFKLGNPIKVYLNVAPLSALHAQLYRAAIEAQPEPSGELAYEIRGEFDGTDEIPDIGLRGTAKIYGDRVSLAYFLFWKPLSYLRRMIGV